ncbi:MAG: hydrogenase maturation protease [Natronomonas sp.]
MTVVVGVGNPTMGDDGVARAVVRELTERGIATEATFVGTTALLALEAMDGSRKAIVVDAIDGDDPPGTIHRVRLDDADAPTEVLMHDFTFAAATRRCESVYDLPDRIVVVGVVPARIEANLALTPTVEAVVPDCVAVVEGEYTGDRTTGDRFMNSKWYCVDCETEISAEAVDEHERNGHKVRGRLRPERLLSQDPWQTGEETNGGET